MGSKHLENAIYDFGRVMVDAGKLIFASIVLGSILKGEFDKSVVVAIGSVVSAALVFCGVWISSKPRS